MLIAEDFGGLAFFVLGVPLALVALTLVSFFASAQGHWSGPVLAAPAILLGLFLTSTLASAPEGDMVLLWLLFGSPLALGIGSVALWAARRGTKLAISIVSAMVLVVVAVLGAVHVVRTTLLEQRAAEVAEHANAVRAEHLRLANERAALADPNLTEAERAKMKAERDARIEQRIKWQQEAVEKAT